MPNRTRTFNDAQFPNFRHLVETASDGTIISEYDELSTFETVPHDYRVITDVVGNRGGFNPVSHRSFQGAFSDLFDYKYNSDHFVRTNPRPVAHIFNSSSSVVWDLLPDELSAASLSAWSTEAFNAFHDQIPRDVLLANFMWELRDIKGMIPRLDKRGISKTVSGNFLAFEFGIKPFISDIKKIANLSDSIAKRIKHLKATAGKEQTLSFKRTLDPRGPEVLRKSYDGSSARIIEYRRQSYQGIFQVTGKLTQNLDELDGPNAGLKAFAAATGFNNPAAIVWEAIPYSFVVDWFFQIGNQIDRLSIQPFGGEWSLRDVGYSVKETWTYFVYQDFLTGDPWYNEKHLLGVITCKSYVRRPGFPLSSLFLTTGTLTPKQLALGVALLEQVRH